MVVVTATRPASPPTSWPPSCPSRPPRSRPSPSCPHRPHGPRRRGPHPPCDHPVLPDRHRSSLPLPLTAQGQCGGAGPARIRARVGAGRAHIRARAGAGHWVALHAVVQLLSLGPLSLGPLPLGPLPLGPLSLGPAARADSLPRLVMSCSVRAYLGSSVQAGSRDLHSCISLICCA